MNILANISLRTKFCICAAAVTGLIGFCWLHIKSGTNQPLQANLPENGTSSYIENNNSPAHSSFHLASEYPQIILKGKTRTEAITEAMARVRLDPHAPTKTRIDFYGKIVDENNHPIQGVDVTLAWRASSTHTLSKKTTTKTDGSFDLTGEHGETLGVYLEKDGYYIPRDIQQLHFEFFQPAKAASSETGSIIYNESSQQQPFVFQLRRKHEVGEFIKKSVTIVPPVDGSLADFDFISGKLVYGDRQGQLNVRTWKKVKQPYPYEWRVIINIPNGGFSRTGAKGEFAFTAPTDGYSSTIDWTLRSTAESFDGRTIAEQMYFCYGDPKQYGRLTISTRGSRNDVELQYVINLKPGDRNLEAYQNQR